MIINNKSLSNLSVFESEVALFALPQNSQFSLPKSKYRPLEILLKSNILCIKILVRVKILLKSNVLKSKNYCSTQVHIMLKVKGQLISKGLFNVIIWTKNLTNFFKDFCPSL